MAGGGLMARRRRRRPRGAGTGPACLGLLLAVGLPVATLAQDDPAPAPAGPWSFNIGLFSQYASRGISYTHEQPALQATALYSHPSGWYAGLWLTNVSRYFIHDGLIESDPFGGYAGSRGDWSYDVGFWRWTFTGASLPVSKRKYDTIELYASIGWKMFSVRVWREMTDYFGLNSQSAPVDAGVPPGGSSRGSIYLEGNASFELPRRFSLGLHLGRQSVHGYPQLSYSEYRVSLDRDLGSGWQADLAFGDTDADPALYQDAGGLNVARAKWFGSIKKTF
jgi:uncharacterized protein (TIGR02001 family)